MTLFSFDCETFLITERMKSPKPVCISVADATNTYLIKPDDEWFLNAITDPNNIWVGHNVFYDMDCLMCWYPHMIPHFIRAISEGRVFDTGIRWQLRHLKNHGSSFGFRDYTSLADLEKKYLGIDRSAAKQGDDIWRLKYGTLNDVPLDQWPEDARQYALDDARGTYDVFIQLGGLDDHYPTEHIQIKGGAALHAASVWGFYIDLEKHAEVKQKLVEEIAALKPFVDQLGWAGKGSAAKLQDAVGKAWRRLLWTGFQEELNKAGWLTASVNFDVEAYDFHDSIQQWLVHGDNTCGGIASDSADITSIIAKLPTPPRNKPKTKKNKDGSTLVVIPYVTDAEVLKTLEPYNDYFPKFLEWKHAGKMLSTYLEAHEKQVIHPRFSILKVTGRTGASSPNVQNVPGDFRVYFSARHGYQLSVNDYSALELCTLAATCLKWFDYSDMATAINEGKDLHCTTAAMIIGMSYEEFMQRFKNKETHTSGITFKDLRQGAKPTNFGRPGGLGDSAQVSYAERQYGVKMTMEEAKESKKALFNAYPEIKHYLKHSAEIIKQGGGHATAFTTTGRERAECNYTEVSNTPFQGLAADGAKTACWEVHKEHLLAWYYQNNPLGSGWGIEYKDSPLVNTHLVNFIHDELVNEVPDGEAGERAHKRIQELMVEAMSSLVKGVTIRVEGELGEGWTH